MEITKICFKCGRELPLSAFYKHPQMRDGHLNKCKDCTKAEARCVYLNKSKHEEYMAQERARGREKYSRLGYRGKLSERQKLKRKMYPGLRSTRKKLGLKLPRTYELHHWNYNLVQNVILIPRGIHSRLHSVISLNIEEGIYYHNGEKLDTLDKHLAIVRKVCQDFGYDYNAVKIY